MPRFTQADLLAKGYGPDGHRLPKLGQSMPGPSIREKDLHAQILAICQKGGFAVVHSRMDRPTNCGIGTPDLVVAMPGGRTLWIECKTGGTKLRPEQAAWMRLLFSLGHHAYVVRSPADFLDILNKIK